MSGTAAIRSRALDAERLMACMVGLRALGVSTFPDLPTGLAESQFAAVAGTGVTTLASHSPVYAVETAMSVNLYGESGPPVFVAIDYVSQMVGVDRYIQAPFTGNDVLLNDLWERSVAAVNSAHWDWHNVVLGAPTRIDETPAKIVTVQGVSNSETLLIGALRRAFPNATFATSQEIDPEEGWTRPYLRVRTGIDDIDTRMALEERFYADTQRHESLTAALRAITVIFE